MSANPIDPNGLCNSATNNLQSCLIEEGKRLAASGFLEQALATYFRAYSLRPNQTPILHSIAAIYEADGDSESAMACRRGVIPRRAELHYFNANDSNSRTLPARRASNCQHLQTHAPESISLRPPKSNSLSEERPEFRASKTESRGSFASVLTDASFWFDGFNTIIRDNRDRILKEHIKGNSHLIADISRHRAERYLEGTVCFLDARSSSIYYHWIIDVLPKVAILQRANISLESIDHFVVRCNPGFQQQTLEHLGIPLSRITPIWGDGMTRCQKLIVPFLKHDRGDRFYNGLGLGMASWVPKWLKSTFSKPRQPPKQCQNKKLYISRSQRGTRLPSDESILVAELERRGFVCVFLETMSVVEQAQLMASASFVVSAHGAGLTNITFCKNNTCVVEIFGDYVVPCYWALSELSDLDYHAYFVEKQCNADKCDTNKQKNMSLAERRQKNIDLNVDDFLEYIDKLPASKQVGARRLNKPALLRALETLKLAADEQSKLSAEDAFEQCRTASHDISYAHVLYLEISRIAIKLQLWKIADEFAVRTLKKLPSSGAAIKVLGQSLEGQGNLSDAAICFGYRLPTSIREQYFSSPAVRKVNSDASRNVKCLPAYASEYIPLKPPLTLLEKPIPELSLTHLQSAPAKTYSLKNAKLWFDGFHSIIWDSEGQLIEDASRGIPDIVQSSLSTRSCQKLPGKTCLLGNRNSDNYYHWMNDILPRLHVLSESGIPLDSIHRFIINPLKHPFQFETLQRFNIDETRLHLSEDSHYFHCDELFIPSFGSNSLGKGHGTWIPNFLQSTFLPLNSSGKPCERLYISRKNANGRAITNEEELVEKLKIRGFRRVYLESLSVNEQAILFSYASVVLGSHGAGFSNIVFCQEGTSIIELYANHILPCYWISSELLSLRHAVHYCGEPMQSNVNQGDDADIKRLSDITVDLEAIGRLLDQLQIKPSPSLPNND